MIGGGMRRLHSLAGWNAVLLLHGLLLIVIRDGVHGRRAPPEQDARMTMVMITPPALPKPLTMHALPSVPVRKTLPTVPGHVSPRAITVLPEPPQASEPAQAPIDVDVAVKSAGRIRLEDERPVAQLQKRQAAAITADQKFGNDVARSARPDCRKAHADKGLFAPLFLAHDAVTDRGCKW